MESKVNFTMYKDYEVVASSDTRNYLEETNRIFSDYEIAGLVYNHSIAPKDVKIEWLTYIMEHTDNDILSAQINGRLRDMDAWRTDTLNSFEEAYISILHPFRKGDIVRILGTNKLGVVCSAESDEKLKKYERIMRESIKEDMVENIIGYTDCYVCVDTFYDSYDYLSVFNHEHINPVDIEYARLPKDDLRQGFLEYMKVTICRESAFGPGRSEQRIPAVLEQIRKVWSSYPDMRLGQLILCCSTNNRDLFAMEDEVLMEKLQRIKNGMI